MGFIVKEKRMIIAVDFDGVICTNGYFPDIGQPNMRVINALIAHRKKGTHLILWTCRTGEALVQAVNFCKNFGLEFDAVNENLHMMAEAFGEDCRKVYADYYLDDKAMTVESLLLGTGKKPEPEKKPEKKFYGTPSKVRIVRK